MTQHPIQLIGAILWPSFVLAGCATAVFFSTFDPPLLGEIATFPMPLSRIAGYSLGFFGFWALSAASSISTLMLLGLITLPTDKHSPLDKHSQLDKQR